MLIDAPPLAKTFSGVAACQHAGELDQYLSLVKQVGVLRYLEIGCRHGDTFHQVMTTIGPGGFGVALDLPRFAENKIALTRAIDDLRGRGIKVRELFGSSHERELIDGVMACAPFDLILIDADHRYEAVKRDWKIYGAMAPIVAFHDIAAPPDLLSAGNLIGVPKLWSEIKQGFRHTEFVEPGSYMGFGVLFRS